MRFQIKQFLLILIMLVLPVQTFASATMLGCVFSHPGQALFQQMEQQTMAGESKASCHESEQTNTSPTPHNCKHCSVCHAASTLMVPAVDTAPVVLVAHSIIPHAEVAFTGFISDSPERPPRIFFA